MLVKYKRTAVALFAYTVFAGTTIRKTKVTVFRHLR